jgi:hypothetical protein
MTEPINWKMLNIMKIKRKNPNPLLSAFMISMLMACNPFGNEKKTPTANEKKQEASFLARVDSAKKCLQNGNIILRKGNDVISAMFAQMNRTDATFSHCGIAFQEDSTWWVYHSIGGEDNPDEKLKRETFDRFVSHEHNHGFGIVAYALDSMQLSDLQHIVHSFHQQAIPFDMKFDLESNDRFYCAEMVYKAFSLTMRTDTFFTTTEHNGFKYVSTDNIFINPKAKLKTKIFYFE